MTEKEQIRAEIERQRSLIEGLFIEGDNNFYDGQNDAYNHLLAFINSLPEEKPSEDFEEVARLYADNQIPTDYPDYFCRQDIKDAFIAGAECGIKSQEKKIADAYEKGKQEGIRIVRSWESSPGQCGY